jgi:phage gpG-like protein
VRVELDFFGEDLVASKIVGVGERAEDLRPAFRRVVKLLNQAATRQFDSEGVYGSGGWAPLAASTKRQKAAKGLDPRILHATGRLKGSLQGKNADRIQRVNRQSLVFGTYTRYAVFHVRGTSARRSKSSPYGPLPQGMPKRRPMELTKGDRRLITRSIYERVMAEAGRF